MRLVLDFSPVEERHMKHLAAGDGVSITEYVRQHFFATATLGKYRAIDFSAACKRSPEEIEAHIADVEDSHSAWEERDRYIETVWASCE